MRIKAPSLGFLYVLLALGSIVWLYVFLARTPWYEKTGPERDLARAAYLERIAPRVDRVRRESWLDTSLGMYIQHEDWDSVMRLLRLHKFYRLVPNARGINVLSQDEVWSFNFSDDKWTTGHQLARFLFYNPKDEPQQYAFHWRTKGPGKAHYDSGDGELRPFELIGDDWKEARVLVQTIPAKSYGLYRFKADIGFALPGDERRLGLHLDRIDFDVK